MAYLVYSLPPTITDPARESSLPTFPVICLGGTFDRIHDGHRLFLASSARLVADNGKILLGLTDGALLSKKGFFDYINPFEVRAKRLKKLLIEYLDMFNKTGITVDIFPIVDQYGPSTTNICDNGLLIVSVETLAGGHSVNLERVKLGRPEVNIAVVPIVADKDGTKLSSTKLRELDSLSSSMNTSVISEVADDEHAIGQKEICTVSLEDKSKI